MTPELLEEIARRFGTPCYVYDLEAVRERVRTLRGAFSDRFHVSWAMKSNPNPTLVERMKDEVDALDVSSAGEVRAAIRCGWDPAAFTFAGPAKRPEELALAVEVGVGALVVESLEEADEAARQAAAAGARVPVVLRVAPRRLPKGFGSAMAGRPTPFGIDEEELDAAIPHVRSLAALDLQGFHAFAGTQCLDAESVAANLTNLADLMLAACRRNDLRARRLVFGSGFGIPYHDGDAPLDLARVAAEIDAPFGRLSDAEETRDASLSFELGRWLVGEAGVYLTRVLRVKRSRGATIGVLDGGMHHHLAAAGHLGSVLPRNYPISLVAPRRAAAPTPVDLSGPLCTSIDVLARRIALPGIEAGDLLAVRQSGAYGRSASPLGFLSHAPPKEILVERDANGTPQASDVTPSAVTA